jgi:tRNA threonylcarbamoyl adenosine modification protein YeaZ
VTAGTILAFDTAAAQCAAAVVRDGAVVASACDPMARGQAEHLVPMLGRLLADAGTGWRDLAAVAVGIGPGNFTGTRLSVATARGLALGLGVPAFGISAFEALIDPDAPAPPDLLASVEAPHAMAHVQVFARGRPQGAPRLVDPADLPPDLAVDPGRHRAVLGHRAAEIAQRIGGTALPAWPAGPAERLGLAAAWKWRHGHDIGRRPAPLYVRPADAAPPSDPAPPILP